MKNEIKIYKAVQYLIEALGFHSVKELENKDIQALVKQHTKSLDKEKIKALNTQPKENKK